METGSLTETIYTDYQKEVKVANDPSLFIMMVREDKLLLLQYILLKLYSNPLV